jgi:hypothetical protein
MDNQGRSLAGVKRHQDFLARAAKVGRVRSDKAAEGDKHADWVVYKGVQCLRVDKESYVGVPNSGRKNSKRFDIINVKTGKHIAQVSNKEVRGWLFRMWKLGQK